MQLYYHFFVFRNSKHKQSKRPNLHNFTSGSKFLLTSPFNHVQPQLSERVKKYQLRKVIAKLPRTSKWSVFINRMFLSASLRKLWSSIKDTVNLWPSSFAMAIFFIQMWYVLNCNSILLWTTPQLRNTYWTLVATHFGYMYHVSVSLLVEQGKSEGFDSCYRPSNLTQIGFKSSIFPSLCDLGIW